MTRILRALALAALAATACAKKPETAPAPVERALSTARVEQRDAAAPVEFDGTVVGRSEAVLASRLAAPVVEVLAVPGRSVRAGAVLVRLEAGESDSAAGSARAAVASARSELERAQRNRARFERLAERGAAAPVELERARQEETAAAAGLASAEALSSHAQTDRSQSVLVAPFDAIVVEKMVSPGDLAAPGRPLVRLASAHGRRVEASPGEQEASRLSAGDEVELELGGERLKGRVAEIVAAVDPATRRRLVRIDLPPGVEPAIGTFARLILPGPSQPRLLVPGKAIVTRGGLELAWAIGEGGGVSLRYVRTGPAAGDGLVEVRSGLAAGDRVVIDPPADLEAGTRVKS
jgi:RND family efflux transporter MFP subunit